MGFDNLRTTLHAQYQFGSNQMRLPPPLWSNCIQNKTCIVGTTWDDPILSDCPICWFIYLTLLIYRLDKLFSKIARYLHTHQKNKYLTGINKHGKKSILLSVSVSPLKTILWYFLGLFAPSSTLIMRGSNGRGRRSVMCASKYRQIEKEWCARMKMKRSKSFLCVFGLLSLLSQSLAKILRARFHPGCKIKLV